MYAKYDKETGKILGHYLQEIHVELFNKQGLPLSDDMVLLTDSEWQLSIEGKLEIKDGKAVEKAPVELTIEEIQRQYINAVQTMLDNKVKERGYDNIVSVASYFNSTDEIFKQEAELAVAWRDDVWRTCYTILAEVLNGTREQPTIEELLAELPLLNWSEEE